MTATTTTLPCPVLGASLSVGSPAAEQKVSDRPARIDSARNPPQPLATANLVSGPASQAPPSKRRHDQVRGQDGCEEGRAGSASCHTPIMPTTTQAARLRHRRIYGQRQVPMTETPLPPLVTLSPDD